MDDAGTIVSEYIGTDGSRRKYRRFICLLRMGMEIGCWETKEDGTYNYTKFLMPCMQQTGKLEVPGRSGQAVCD